MHRMIVFPIGCFIAIFGSACNQEVIAPVGDILLESLEFVSTEVDPGEPLILIGRTAAEEVIGPQPFVIRVSSGARLQGSLRAFVSDCFRQRVRAGESEQAAVRGCWAALSDEEIAALIGVASDNRVMIGFKEADAEWGVDEQGQNITSEETLDRMKEWVQKRGVVITRESVLIPSITGTMPARADLVASIRGHENIDYLEPSLPGEPFGGFPDGTGSRGVLIAILTRGRSVAEHLVRSGDVVTAEYRQPDGSVLQATASVR
jgi:hypothetical protein